MKRRVVITGTGAVTSLGTGADALWQGVKNGKCGINRIERVDVSDMPTKCGAEVKEFDPSPWIDKKELRRMDRFAQFALAAACMAADSAKLDTKSETPERVGVVISSGIGGIETLISQHLILLEKGPAKISPFFVPMMISNMAAAQVAIRFNAKGFSESVSTACASSTNAIGDAFRVIQNDDADVIFAGGAEAPLTRLTLAGFCANRTMSVNEDPMKACRPFDKDRDGFLLGEGAAVLILEEYEHAVARGATILAELVGYGCTNDAFHITAPAENGEGGARCMALALKEAGITGDQVDYVNAHGTSTGLNDPNETKAIKTVFGEHAWKLAISSSKSMHGHALAAAGAIEAIVTTHAVAEGFAPPTINYCTPDPECDLDYVPNVGRELNIRHAISNSFGFGGHNATLVFKKI